MTADLIRAFVKRQPFVPFTIHMSDGRRLEVRHPESVALPPNWSTTAIVFHQNGKNFDFVYIRNVTSIQSEDEVPSSKRKKRGDEDSQE